MARSKKSSKKIQKLIFIMLITVVLGITATYAWFSTQRDVEIAGMRLNVEVAESMQISLDGEKWSQSINIADMRQFYGTYQETGSEGFAIFQAKKVTDGGNQNYVPTELFPVSTAGEVASGKLKFVQGTVANNVDGTQSLTGITACTEADITTTADVDDKEENNEDHPYFVFDMYLRNISAKESGIDELELNEGSSVFINTATTDDTEQEGKGQSGTGLEYSARVGFVIYGNTVSVTAKDDETLGTVGEQIRGITANNSEVAAIWEPNFREHTQYVVNNNGRGITSLSQQVTTYGIKSAVALQAVPNNKVVDINADTDANSDGIEDTNANLVAVKTFKPAYTTVAGGTDDKEVITNTAGNNIGLAPNKISKVRVYIWLEGQDPDCIDLASTGDKLNINLKLTKEANTIQDNTYNGAYTGGGSGGGAGGSSNGITASQIYAMTDAEKTAIYGATVTNYKPTNGASDNEETGTKWRIFHADSSNIYLIADDYVDRAYVPTGRGEDGQGTNGIAVGTGTKERGFSLAPYADYNGTSDVASNIASKLLSQYTTAGYTATSTKDNAKATAYLLDTTMWSGFKDRNGYAEYAIGGPTLELFRDSYNVTHPEKTIETQASSETGYKVKWSTDASYANAMSGLNRSESLYVISSTTNANGMWVASPSADYSYSVMRVYYDGTVNGNGYVNYNLRCSSASFSKV